MFLPTLFHNQLLSELECVRCWVTYS